MVQLKNNETYAIDQTATIYRMPQLYGLTKLEYVSYPYLTRATITKVTSSLSSRRGRRLNQRGKNFSLGWVAYFVLLDIQDPNEVRCIYVPESNTSAQLQWLVGGKTRCKVLEETKDMKIHVKIEVKECSITVTSLSNSDFGADKADRNSVTRCSTQGKIIR